MNAEQVHQSVRCERASERGAGMLEYALLTSIIAIALVVSFQAFGSGISANLSDTVAAFN